MTYPLRETQYKEIMASKPGNLKDKYIKVQNINNAINRCKEDIKKATGEILSIKFLERNIFPFIDKWLLVAEKKK